MEKWKDVKGFEDYYEVSDLGNVRSKVSGNLLTPFENSRGYLQVDLRYIGFKRIPVHKLVIETFNPDGYFEGADIDHVDGNKKNNAFSNLEYVTHAENTRRHYRKVNEPAIGISPDGELHEFIIISEFAREHDLDFRHVAACLSGKLAQIKGWKFYYKTDGKPKKEARRKGKTKKCIGVSPEGAIHEFMNQQKFADEHDLSRRQINACLNGSSKSHKGWTFNYGI